ncbi:GntR family transcriptional regulator [Vagococcus acidifermentans]|uniref:GntR family transcriptional regulator n=1 Tax=Vagococcus acidifermentans TaxID=564710 RepID=A0A430ATV2_9ENTE|nr:GntR family transcriptional regulator [Vagococcus acidifermentans]RSU11499.1 GntR family transcriptional regulator [Vagococcus acidifermentans]
MNIIINNSSMIPIYEQLIDQIKSQIIDGRISEGESLPSVRAMAKELRISALTVKKAYDLLEMEGFITTVHGKGSYVNSLNVSVLEEENKKEIEAAFDHLIKKARLAGLTDEEIASLFTMLLEGEQ